MPTTKKLAKALASQSNESFWQEVVKNSPKFASYTPAGTQARLTEDGVEAITKIPEAVDEFYGTLLRVVFQKLDVARAKNGFEATGLMEEWAMPEAEFAQRMAVGDVAPISPQYRNLKNGDSVDQYVINMPKIIERFLKQNLDQQALLTIQNPNLKRIFLEEGQIGALVGGLLEGIETGRIIQENILTKEVLNKGINSTEHPLQNTQQYKVDTITTNDVTAYTEDMLTDLLVALGDIFSGMFAVDMPATGMFNAAGFRTRVDADQYVMFMRSGIKNRLNKITRAGTYNPQYLNLELENRVYDINDFGGTIPYTESAHENRLYPIFTKLGADTGYYITAANATAAGTTLVAKTQGDTTIGYQIAEAGVEASSIANVVAENAIAAENWLDPNADIIAVIAQRGIMGINRQNGYTITPVPNYAGLYDNYWASAPNNGIYYDYNYNIIVIRSNVTA